MEDNKLIAEFMGVEKENGLYLFTTPMDDYKTDTLYFDVSWDWLMPVITKINVVVGYDDYNQGRIHLQRTLDDCINENAIGIEDVYEAVVDFIINHKKQI